jgi:hypothetical protein
MGTVVLLTLVAFLAIECGAIGIVEWARGNYQQSVWFSLLSAGCCISVAIYLTVVRPV